MCRREPSIAHYWMKRTRRSTQEGPAAGFEDALAATAIPACAENEQADIRVKTIASGIVNLCNCIKCVQ